MARWITPVWWKEYCTMAKKQPRSGHILGADPFADMGNLEWLGVESPPAPFAVDIPPSPTPPASETRPESPPVSPVPQEIAAASTPAVSIPPVPDADEAERLLREWLREENPPETPSEAPPLPLHNAQARLLARLLAEQEPR